MTTVSIIWNPTKADKEELEDALRALTNPNDEIRWYPTTKNDPGGAVARDAIAADPDVILVAGGDGTVRAVAEALASSTTAIDLGIIPLGTGNLLARNLQIPLGDLPKAFERALSQETKKPVDIGWVQSVVNGEPMRLGFMVIIGIGIDAHMITETDDELKAKAGWLAYVESLGRAFHSSDHLEITTGLDDEEQSTSRAHTLMIGNCGTIQGGLTLLPEADPSDGKLDLVQLNAEGVGQWLDTVKSYVWDNGLKRLMGQRDSADDTATVSHRQATKITVALSEPRVLEVDGEDIGEVREFTVQIQASALVIR